MVTQAQRNTHYRLSIIYAGLEDSGQYTCETELGLRNTVAVVVTRLSCPPLSPSTTQHEVRLNSSLTHVGAVVSVSCPTGWKVRGESVLYCRDDGEAGHVRAAHYVPLCDVQVAGVTADLPSVLPCSVLPWRYPVLTSRY